MHLLHIIGIAGLAWCASLALYELGCLAGNKTPSKENMGAAIQWALIPAVFAALASL